jgi:hypothetical protein
MRNTATTTISSYQVGEGISVKWNDGHESLFSGSWIKKHAYSPKIPSSNTSLLPLNLSKHHDYAMIMTNDSALYSWISSILSSGLGIVKNVPPLHTRELIERICHIRTTHYGADSSNAISR